MAHRKLYAYRLTVYKASSGTDTSRVPADGVTMVIAKRGAITQGAGNDNAGAGATITVHNINSIVVGDILLINTNTVVRFVASVTATTITLVGGGSGTFEWVDGDTIRTVSGAPTMYTDAEGAESVALSTTDSSGEAEFYSLARIVDVLLTDSGTLTLLKDIGGDDGQEDVRPEDWAAERDGATNDTASFTDMLEYVAAQGGALKIKLGAGVYRLGSVMTLAALTSVEIEGQGIGVTTIEINHAAVGIDLTGACTDVVLKNLTLNRLSGTAAAIQVSSASVRPRVENVLFKGGGIGIDDNGSDDARYVNTFFTTGTWVSCITLNDAARPHITDLVARFAANWTRAIDVSTGCTRVRLDKLDISPAGAFVGIGLHVRDDAAGTDPKGVFLVNSHISAGSTANCIVIDKGDGILIDACEFTAAAKAIVINGGNGITITSCQSDNMQSEAIDINATADVLIVGLLSSDASQSGAGNTAHIEIASGIDNVTVIGGRFGAFITSSGTHGDVAVNITGGASESIIVIGAHQTAGSSSAVIADGSDAGSVNGFGYNITQVTATAITGGPSGKSTLLVSGTDTTFDATGVETIQLHQTSTTALLTITGGYLGQVITLIRGSAGNVVVNDDSGSGTGLFLAGSASFTLTQTSAMQLVKTSAGSDTWSEISRSTN